MKKILFTIYLKLMFVNLLFAQSVVTDPGSYAHMADQLVQMKQQMNVLIETKEQLGKAQETLSDIKKATSVINTTLKQINLIERIVRNQQRVIIKVQDSHDYLAKSGQFKTKEMRIILGNFSQLMRRSEQSLSVANSLLKEGFFKMTDKDRIDVLMEMNKEVMSINSEIAHIDRTYRRVASMRLLNETFFEQKP